MRRELRQLEPEIYHDVSHWRWRSQIDVPAETHSTLAPLSARWPLVAITNGNVSPEACGLAGYLRHILRACPDGRAKPWQDMYQLAAAQLNVPPQSILHVGDDLEADVTGAMRYGMQACWINDRGDNFAAADARLLPHL